MKEIVKNDKKSTRCALVNISLARSFFSFSIFVVNIICCLDLLLDSWHGDKTGLDSDFKVKFNTWNLSFIVLLNFLTKFLDNETINLCSVALLVCTLPETTFITHYNVAHGYTSKAAVWIIFQLSTLISFSISFPKISSKPIPMPVIVILGAISNFVGFLLIAIHAWKSSTVINDTPKSLYSSTFGLAIVSLLNLFVQLISTICDTTISLVNGATVLSFVLMFSLKNITESKLVSAGCAFLLIGATTFLFKLGFRVYKKISGVFGRPTVDTVGNYIPPTSAWKKRVFRLRTILLIISIVMSIIGIILYFTSRVPKFASVLVFLFLGGIIMNSLTYIFDVQLEISILSVCFAAFLMPELIILSLSGSSNSKASGILLGVALLMSFIPLFRKVTNVKKIYLLLTLISLLLVLIDAIALLIFAVGRNCYSSNWDGVTPFSCTLWYAGHSGDKFLTVALPTLILSVLTSLFVIFKLKEFIYVSIFLLTQQTVNYIQPVLQQNSRFQLSLIISLIHIGGLIVSILSITVLVKLNPEKSDNDDCKEDSPLLK